jgi:4-aminobutyrate aminotransferase/(S)-3-amino-2-methylpropionate transaminase
MTRANTEALLKRREKAVPKGPFNLAPVFVERARGAKLWDVDGREYIDFCGGIGTMNVGHNHPRVVDAIQTQTGEYVHTCWHVAMYEPYVRLAERLNDLTPTGTENRTALFNSGAEAGENAVKIARKASGRPGVISFQRGFHGRTLMGMTLTGKVNPYTAGFGPFAPEVYRLPYRPFFDPPEPEDDEGVRRGAREALHRLFHYHVEAEAAACLIVEPVLGEGGFFPLHPAAARELADACRQHGILFVSDEIQSGFGRTGAMLAIEGLGIRPDMVCYAKSLAGGLPLSAVTGRADVMEAPQVGGIGGTFGGNPVACAAALAVLDVMEEEELPRRAQVIGDRLMESFRRLEGEHDHVRKARGVGAMCAIEIVDPGTGAPDKDRCDRVLAKAREGGLLAMAASGNIIRTLMPLVIRDEELNEGVRVLEESVAAA